MTIDRRAWVEMVMGLPVSVVVRGSGAGGDRADELVQAMYADLRRADRVFSTYRADSEISLIRSRVLDRELASFEVREVLALCEQARELTDGLFDADLMQADGSRLLDPSGLVKGWAVERAARVLDQLDELDWLVNAGGDVVGQAAHGPAWQVGIEDPAARGSVLAVVPLTHGAVATSGTAARGRHITDPRTGQPAADDLRSATVIGPSLLWADVLATAAFVEGTASLARIEGIESYDAVLVDHDGRVLATSLDVFGAA
jgi:thiamine biosynthesis lipoprotein